MPRKRKRASGYGTYYDEETGECTTVQTTKQAKRQHQKSGKWYKEPTEQELRIWDREEKRQEEAKKALKREKNKKVNALKRTEKEGKEKELKKQLFETGKITFTQTLAKKDEDQSNLHSWFGGKSGQVKSKKPSGKPIVDKEVNRHSDEDGGGITRKGTASGSCRGEEQVRRLSQDSKDGLCQEADTEVFFYEQDRAATITDDIPPAGIGPSPQAMQPVMDLETDLLEALAADDDFEIAEDSGAETEVLNPGHNQTREQVPNGEADVDKTSFNGFKVPALPGQPRRLPLSPVSQSDLNIRASQAIQVSSFKGKLAQANITTPSTQVVRDILAVVSTQDLSGDFDDEESISDKENEEPDVVLEKSPSKTPLKSSPLKEVDYATHTRSSASLNDSFDYDNIFTEIDTIKSQPEAAADLLADREDNSDEDFFDDLDDETLLSLPATQLTSAIKARVLAPFPSPHLRVPSTKPMPSLTLPPAPRSKDTDLNVGPLQTSTYKKPLKKHDSFAVEGLEDEDLLEGLEEYERSQQRLQSVTKKKRTLPWEKLARISEVSGAGTDAQGDGEDDDAVDGDGDGDAEILSSYA